MMYGSSLSRLKRGALAAALHAQIGDAGAKTLAAQLRKLANQ